MKIVLQRVSSAQVSVDDTPVGKIGRGLLLLIGVAAGDEPQTAFELIEKIIKLRVFSDADGKMNLSLRDIQGELLMVSQFTLIADTKKGLRPFFGGAEKPELAKKLFDQCVKRARQLGFKTETGEFGAMMKVELLNDGPVTLVLENS